MRYARPRHGPLAATVEVKSRVPMQITLQHPAKCLMASRIGAMTFHLLAGCVPLEVKSQMDENQTYVFRMTEDQYADLVSHIVESIQEAVSDASLEGLDEAERLVGLAKALFNPAA